MSAQLIPYTGGGTLSSLAGLPDVGGSQNAPSGAPDIQNADNIGQATGEAINATAIPQPKPGVLEQTTKIDPNTGEQTHRLTVTDAFFQQTMKLAQLGQQASAAYDQQVQALQAKQQFMEQNPILASVGKIASLAAAGYQNPNFRGSAIVRAAGLAGMDQFSGTPGEIQGQIAGIQAQNLAAQAPITTAMNDLLKNQLANQNVQSEIANRKQQRLDTIEGDANKQAVAGLFTPEAAGSFMNTYGGQSGDSKAAALKTIQLLSVSNAANAKHQADQVFTTQLDLQKSKEQDQRQANMFQAAAERLASGQQHQEKMKIISDLDIQGNKKTVDVQALESMNSVQNALSHIADSIQQFKNDTGPFAGRILTVKQKLGMLNEQTAEFSNSIQQLVPLLVNMEGAGARGFMKYGLEFQKTLKANVTFDADQNLGIIKGQLQNLTDRRLGKASGFNELQVAAKPNLWGSDYQAALAASAKLPDSVRQILGNAAPGAPAQTTAPTAPRSAVPSPEAVKGLSKGKAIKGPDGRLWVAGPDGNPVELGKQ